MSTAAEAPILIGLGNPLRGDDGAGLELARMVASRAPWARVAGHEGEPTGLIELWEGASLAIVADAAAAAGEPGRVRRAVAGGGKLPFRPAAAASTHAIDLGGVIELAGTLERLPHRLVVYGIEGERFGVGEALSPRVGAALGPLAETVLAELRDARG